VIAKRLFDVVLAASAIVLLSPLMAVLALIIWAQDGYSPFYLSMRVGRANRDFPMIKLRSMVPGAETIGGSSAASSDARITGLGRFIRRWKLDELPQFLNVLAGHMSIVGPRPNVRLDGVDSYAPLEMGLLAVRPGLTDLASIVFADEAEILEGEADADAAYDRLIRPWKCRLGLLYIERQSVAADVLIAALTATAIIARPLALSLLDLLLKRWGANASTRELCLRQRSLDAFLPELGSG
jgi:lipopolysaccharide/colanic/teichoic acid biosynthesis glycosyltransferase